MKTCWQRLIVVSLGFVLSACSGRAGPETDIAPVAVLVVIPTSTATAAPPAARAVYSPTPMPVEAFVAPATDTPRSKPTFTKSPSPEPTATPTPADWLKNVGRTEDNLIYLGNPNAPVTMIDYSDFM